MTATIPVRALTRMCRALGDETRLRIVALLSHGELCVCHLQEALALPQSSVSRQLAVLRAAQIVEHRRDGAWVHYSLRPQEDGDCEQLLAQMVRVFAEHAQLRRDVERLRKSKRTCL